MAQFDPKLKPLTKESLGKALEKAERYRLLNEAREAESICLDILAVEPDNSQALILLFLSLTDQFRAGRSTAVPHAREVLRRIRGDYEQAYYSGILAERRAKARLNQMSEGSNHAAYELLREAMGWYEKAEGLRPAGNDDALLRWNTCVRILERNPDLQPGSEERVEPYLE
jgi:hypothetical protein